MKTAYTAIAERIRREIPDLRREVNKDHCSWQRAQKIDDDAYIGSVALCLHGFYTGVERILEVIAGSIDLSIPFGDQ